MTALQLLREQAIAAFDAGRLEESLELFEEVLDRARAAGDPRLFDRVYCNYAQTAIELGRSAEVVPSLREMLVQAADIENQRLAAYLIARAHTLGRNHKKGLFYARIARDLSDRLQRPDWQASSWNEVGNLLLAETRTGEALAAYERALDFVPDEASVRHGQILANLGYGRALEGDLREALRLLYRSVRMLQRLDSVRALASARVDLTYVLLEYGRPRLAARHARAALRVAREVRDADVEKNALYLLGEAALLQHNQFEARRCFAELEALYPGVPALTEFLLAVDVRKMINLRA